MKCVNETVTIELKNGTRYTKLLNRIGCYLSMQWLTTVLFRNNRARHNHVGLAVDEHCLTNSQDDRPRPRPHLLGYHEHPRFHDPLHHPARLAALRYAPDRRLGETQEQGAQGGCGQRCPGRRAW